MLVLTRKVGEKIVIDGDVIVTVVAVAGNKVRIGVVAPEEVVVDRHEVYERRHIAPPSCPLSNSVFNLAQDGNNDQGT